MRLKLSELQSRDLEAQKFGVAKFVAERWKNIDGVLYYWGLLYVLKIIYLELISCHNNKRLAEQFEIDKT